MSRELCLIGLVGLGIPRLDRSRQQTKLNCRDHTIEHSTICMSERAYNRKRKGTDLQQSSAGVMSQKIYPDPKTGHVSARPPAGLAVQRVWAVAGLICSSQPWRNWPTTSLLLHMTQLQEPPVALGNLTS